MKIDLHCHSKYSYDNFLEPDDLISQALQMNLDGVCFTEHHSVTASLPVEKIQVPDGFFIFRGVEISTTHGHLLAYGLRDDSWNTWTRNNYLDIFKVIKSVHELGGICVPAHPFRGWDSIGDAIIKIDGWDAIETHNGMNPDTANQKAIQLARKIGLPSVGGSDCHKKSQVGQAVTLFDRPIRTIDELVSEIRKGRCRGTTMKKYPDRISISTVV